MDIAASKPTPVFEDVEYRPAAVAPYTTIVRQVMDLVHSQLRQRGCQRLPPENPHKHKPRPGDDESGRPNRELMTRTLARLRVYQRAFGSLVIYFRAYSPILSEIKKSFDDMLAFRLSQFKNTQHERVRLYLEKLALQTKLATYNFPDYKRLQKIKQYCELLKSRIYKQEEAIKTIMEILHKLGLALSEHYEQGRDLEDQIKLLEIETANRREKALHPMMRFVDIVEEAMDKDVAATEIKNAESSAQLSESDEEPIDENEEFDEDKRMVLILAYAVCLKDLDEAERKLKIYETKYQNVAPRHELEVMKRKILEEKAQVKSLLDEREALEQEVVDLKAKNDLVDEELEDLREMPDDLRLESIKRKYAEDKGIGHLAAGGDSSLDLEEEEELSGEFPEEGSDPL